MNVIIGVLGATSEPFLTIIENGIRKTWGAIQHENVEVLYYYGRQQTNNPRADEIFCDVDDSFANIGYKNFLFFDYILKNKKFDYIFRTNVSSYVNIKKYLEFLNDKPKQNFFSGVIGNHNGQPFASGAGYTLSRDLVELAVNKQNEYNHSFGGSDDVGLATLLTSNGITITPADRQIFEYPNDIVKNINLNYFHYRCKSIHNMSTRHKTDVQMMHIIHQLLHESGSHI